MNMRVIGNISLAAATLIVTACSDTGTTVVSPASGGSSSTGTQQKGGSNSSSSKQTNAGGSTSSSSQSNAGGSSNQSEGGSSSSQTSSGGTSNTKTSSSSSPKGGTSSSSSSSAGGSSSKGGTSSSSTTSSSTNKGGSSVGGTSSSSGTSTSTSAGGTTSSSSGSSTAITCSNSDKSVLPIDANGWVDKSCNTYGIQGAFYWYADDNTAKNIKCGGNACVKRTPPWQTGSPGPGMCIKGTTTGVKEDWGAGIGLGLQDSSPDESSVKNPYNATENGVSGFDVTVSGNTNAMDIRIGFGTSSDGKTISPFIPVPDPAGKTVTFKGADQILIKSATIPSDWKSTDPSPPDPTKIYDLQVQVATDTAKAGTAFELCVTAIKPTGGGSVTPTTTCKNTTGPSVSGTDVKDVGSFGVQANVNAASSGSASVQSYSGSGCAAIDVSVSGNLKGSGDSPAAYPSLISGWQWGKGMHGSYTPKKISDFSSIKSSMSFTPPTGNKWDVAYDIWVDPSSSSIPQPSGSTVEVMVWLDYSLTVTTNAIGTKTGTFTAGDGSVWEVWTGNNSGGWKVVSYRRTPSTAAISNFDILQFIKDSTNHGVSSSMYVLGIQAGFELFDVTAGGSISNYTLSAN